MRETKEVAYCKQLLCNLGRYQKIKLLKNSSLDNRERNILYMRFIEGLSVIESAEKINVDESTFNKAQQRSFKKLYKWISCNNIEEIRQLISILN